MYNCTCFPAVLIGGVILCQGLCGIHETLDLCRLLWIVSNMSHGASWEHRCLQDCPETQTHTLSLQPPYPPHTHTADNQVIKFCLCSRVSWFLESFCNFHYSLYTKKLLLSHSKHVRTVTNTPTVGSIHSFQLESFNSGQRHYFPLFYIFSCVHAGNYSFLPILWLNMICSYPTVDPLQILG